MTSPAHVHSMMHCNLNTRDLAAAARFYAELLDLAPGMKTARVPTDGTGLGVEGLATSEVWFMYDHRGPRAAPGLELQEWDVPALVGTHPSEPNHVGLIAVGYAVPELDVTGATLWPARGELRPVVTVVDGDDVPVERILAGPGTTSPVFSHVRINCSDLERSQQWYARLGFEPVGQPVHVVGDRHVKSQTLECASEQSFAIELTQWLTPEPVGAAASPAYHRGLYRIALGVEDVKEAYNVLVQDRPDIDEPLWVELPGTRLGGVWVMFLKDPDGVVVELVQRPISAMTGQK
ncbi:MAG TPA: VOC family protein [Mycobacteriales bacterium]|jgi:catechol 2,3-dioxygenase-like lactoylglutathione lyase family enzyme|nr:VOC family protein [Mycobacteriales bacterium]